MNFGITDEGFIRKRYADIKNELEQKFKLTFGDIRTDPQSGFGQLIGVLADSLALQWELSEDAYYSHYPNSAEGKNLDDVVALNGLTRKGSTSSTIDLSLTGDKNTIIPSAPVFTTTYNALLFPVPSFLPSSRNSI